MVINTVTYTAYNQVFTENFIDKSPEYIHNALLDVCSTYVVNSFEIADTKEAKFVDLKVLNDLPRPEAKSIPAHLQWAFTSETKKPY